jgi:hypothetical protein
MNSFEEILAEQVRLYRHLYDPSMRDMLSQVDPEEKTRVQALSSSF